jgi:hypothetical protein
MAAGNAPLSLAATAGFLDILTGGGSGGGGCSLRVAVVTVVNNTAATVGNNVQYTCTINLAGSELICIPWVGTAPSTGQVLLLAQPPYLFIVGNLSGTWPQD